jgi:hypothetical protein
MLALIYYSNHWNNPPHVYNKFTLACRFRSSLFMQFIVYVGNLH